MDLAGNRYYRNSGTVTLSGLSAMLGAGGLAALVLSPIYVLISYWLPIIQLRFLVTMGFGAVLGVLVAAAATWGCMRSRLVCWGAGALTGMLSLYFSWVWFLWILSGYEVFLLDPFGLSRVIPFLAEAGLWQMRGRPLSGWELYAAWGIEALLIVGFPVFLSSGDQKPFCEGCQCWTEAADESVLLPLTDLEHLRSDLEDERYEVLDKLRSETVDSNECLQATVMKCPRCRESSYLTVSHLTATQDKEGNVAVKSEPIVRHLWIEAEVVDRLLAPPAEPVPIATAEASPQGEDRE